MYHQRHHEEHSRRYYEDVDPEEVTGNPSGQDYGGCPPRPPWLARIADPADDEDQEERQDDSRASGLHRSRVVNSRSR
jgi:hypothetical protein